MCYIITCSEPNGTVKIKRHGGIAQLGERLTGSQEVSGSIPLISTKKSLESVNFQGFFAYHRSERNAGGKNTKLICIGDSLTFGYGVHLSQRWTRLCAQETGWELANEGINGDTTGGMLARMQGGVLAELREGTWAR